MSCHVSTKLYVGNLGYNVSSPDLQQLFCQYGEVRSAQVIVDRETGRAKGFGFVEMASEAEAGAAIGGLNDIEHDGRRLTVSVAKPREARTSSFGHGNQGRGSESRSRRY
jgi:RNA recognition motif-containing protein